MKWIKAIAIAIVLIVYVTIMGVVIHDMIYIDILENLKTATEIYDAEYVRKCFLALEGNSFDLEYYDSLSDELQTKFVRCVK